MDALILCMQHEIAIMRSMLTSLNDENYAIKTGDEPLLDRVMDERVDLMGAFEVQNQLFLTQLRHAADEKGVFFPKDKAPSYLEALELLENCLDEEESELIALKNQIMALFKEIYHQNSVNAKLLKDGVLQRDRIIPFLIKPEKHSSKITVQLLEP